MKRLILLAIAGCGGITRGDPDVLNPVPLESPIPLTVGFYASQEVRFFQLYAANTTYRAGEETLPVVQGECRAGFAKGIDLTEDPRASLPRDCDLAVVLERVEGTCTQYGVTSRKDWRLAYTFAVVGAGGKTEITMSAAGTSEGALADWTIYDICRKLARAATLKFLRELQPQAARLAGRR